MIKIRNYTNEQIEYITENYNNMTVKEIAIALNKSEGSVSNAARKLGLLKQSHKPWSNEEIEYLKNNYIQKTSEEIAKYLGRTVHSINAERDRLNLIRNENWKNEEINFLKNNFHSMTHEEIGKVLNRTTQAITAKCFDLDLYKKELPWTDEDLEFVKNNFMEMKTSDIAKILNRTPSAIEIKAHRMGLKKYPYTCDYHYFDEIDTEEKAYWLGFLTADGWINKREDNNAGVTGIELQYGDINHLKKFNKSIGGNYQITDRWRTCSLSKDKTKKYHMCCIRIFSITMYNSLVKLGFTNNKSFDFYIPKLEDKLIKHYIRGYFDGDGCLCFTNQSFHITFVTASKQLNNDIAIILKHNNFNFVEDKYINNFNTVMYRIDICRNKDKIDFLDWIYQDATIYLDRKYKKYLKVKEKTEHNVSLAS